MGRPFQAVINDRRLTVVHFLREGLSPREIARKLKCRMEIIDRDIKAIEADPGVWNLAYQTGYDYHDLKEAIRLEDLAEKERLKALGATVEAIQKRAGEIVDSLDKPPKVISRGPKRAREHIVKRRVIVNELRYRGVKQGKISQMLNTPLRTIQADYAHLRERPYEVLKAQEIAVRGRLSVFTDEELVEALFGSPERQKELWERTQDPRVRFDLRWVKRKR